MAGYDAGGGVGASAGHGNASSAPLSGGKQRKPSPGEQLVGATEGWVNKLAETTEKAFAWADEWADAKDRESDGHGYGAALHGATNEFGEAVERLQQDEQEALSLVPDDKDERDTDVQCLLEYYVREKRSSEASNLLSYSPGRCRMAVECIPELKHLINPKPLEECSGVAVCRERDAGSQRRFVTQSLMRAAYGVVPVVPQKATAGARDRGHGALGKDGDDNASADCGGRVGAASGPPPAAKSDQDDAKMREQADAARRHTARLIDRWGSFGVYAGVKLLPLMKRDAQATHRLLQLNSKLLDYRKRKSTLLRRLSRVAGATCAT